MKNTNDSVCHGCEKRAAGCGATCEAFKAERAARHKRYERKYAENKVTSASIELRKGRGRSK